MKEYNFDKFNMNSYAAAEDNESSKAKKTNLKNYHFDDDITDEVNPINTDTSDSKYLFDNEDAIVFDLKKPNKK